MVIYYNNEGHIEIVEHFTKKPFMLENNTLEEVVNHYAKHGLKILVLDKDVEGSILDYKVLTNKKGDFIGLQSIEGDD